MYKHCDHRCSSGTTVCAVERNNKKIEAKSEGTQNALAFGFCSAHLKPILDSMVEWSNDFYFNSQIVLSMQDKIS